MTHVIFTRFALTGALLATAALAGVTSAEMQDTGAGAHITQAQAPGAEAAVMRRIPWMKEVSGDCSGNSVACNFNIVTAPAGIRIEVRNTYCLVGTPGESSELQTVALTRGGQSPPTAFLVPTKTVVDRFGNSQFVVTQESFYFANPGQTIAVQVAADDADIRFAICTSPANASSCRRP